MLLKFEISQCVYCGEIRVMRFIIQELFCYQSYYIVHQPKYSNQDIKILENGIVEEHCVNV